MGRFSKPRTRHSEEDLVFPPRYSIDLRLSIAHFGATATFLSGLRGSGKAGWRIKWVRNAGKKCTYRHKNMNFSAGVYETFLRILRLYQ